MKTLSIYLVRLFLGRTALVLLGTTLFALSAELMETGEEVMTRESDAWQRLFEYALLNLPTFLSSLLPVSALVAGLWMVGVLHRQKELIAVLNTGLSPSGLIRLVLIASVPLVLLQFALDNWIAPRAISELRSWEQGPLSYQNLVKSSDDWMWLTGDHDVIRMANPKPKSRTFAEVTIFRRDAEGLLFERIDAPVARFTDTGLMLENAVIRDTADTRVRAVPSYRWLGRIDFDLLQILSWAPSDLSLTQLNEVIDNAGYGRRPVNIYRTQYNARLVAALQPLFMLLLSMSLIPSYSRTRSFAWIFLIGISIGFSIFILTGITTAMGEAGLLPPWLAAWAPVVALLALIARFLLQHEVLTSNRRGAPDLA